MGACQREVYAARAATVFLGDLDGRARIRGLAAVSDNGPTGITGGQTARDAVRNGP